MMELDFLVQLIFLGELGLRVELGFLLELGFLVMQGHLMKELCLLVEPSMGGTGFSSEAGPPGGAGSPCRIGLSFRVCPSTGAGLSGGAELHMELGLLV